MQALTVFTVYACSDLAEQADDAFCHTASRSDYCGITAGWQGVPMHTT